MPEDVVAQDRTSASHVRIEHDWSGSGHVTRIVRDGVMVWSWARHIDGPMPLLLVYLLEAVFGDAADG